ncbi:hypothetical protein IEQ44_05520 [Nocardioides sp. Y6]|uniref:HNH endonuclease n=1 Tax=Nocardioides malaquae TaxID=2773426 RepID=A0ABR9RRA7_9ACTN|nr:hypothetical protein [Nocardioides malaquae]MBE7324104.1 hypothetical protein [Nocardioides malaquae]
MSGERIARACWWCGAPADSREHKFKRSDLTAAFGEGAWVNRSVAHGRGRGREERISYPNAARSSSLKFEPVMCSHCNSVRSQPADGAYDQFAAFIRDNGDDLYDSAVLDWSTIFPESWAVGRDQVVRYWVKHIACRLAEREIQVLPALIEFMNGTGPMANLRLAMEIRRDFVRLQRDDAAEYGDQTRALWMGDLIGWSSRSTGRFEGASSHWGIDALFVTWEYSVDDPLGSTNFGERVNVIPDGAGEAEPQP